MFEHDSAKALCVDTSHLQLKLEAIHQTKYKHRLAKFLKIRDDKVLDRFRHAFTWYWGNRFPRGEFRPVN